MSYHLYHTEAFVLSSANRGEGNKSFTLFTREFGLLSASATSVREERSKLRFALQDFSLAELTLVRGRTEWHVTNATLIDNVRSAFRRRDSEALLFARIFRLLRRLLTGEEKNERLFDAVLHAFNFLKALEAPRLIPPPFRLRTDPPRAERGGEVEEGWGKRIDHVEIVLVLRILYLLGYLAPRGEFESMLSDLSLWNETLLTNVRVFRSLALQDINNSLRESQL